MDNRTLVILAAGMGSRFGTRIKQLEPIGPNGEIIIDYSVNYAAQAGFDKVIFIIRKDIEELFKEAVGKRAAEKIRVEYVFQERNILPVRSSEFAGRTKPWGTAQALYCCKDVIDGNFGVINADDFYGKKAFFALSEFLKAPDASACSVGFVLENTLSDNGTVNRGVCSVDENGLLIKAEEIKKIGRTDSGAVTGTRNGKEVTLSGNDIVSMSMWGFTPRFMDRLSSRLAEFIGSLSADDTTSEMTIADVVDMEIKQNGYDVRNISTDSKWYGITYEADAELVRNALRADEKMF